MMAFNGNLTLVGFGFGPIQAGLFVLEAFRSGHFGRVVIGEVLPDIVRSVREAGGKFRINIAQRDGVELVTLGPVSAVIADPDRVSERGLHTVSSRDPRAFLVESFNRILISSVRFPSGLPFRRGLDLFEEKGDLLPFEEAKLYGHNAAHALAA